MKFGMDFVPLGIGPARPILQTLQLQGPPLQGGPQCDYPKTLKAVLLFIKMFVLAGLSPPCVVFHIA
jgi:hypothetical protein